MLHARVKPKLVLTLYSIRFDLLFTTLHVRQNVTNDLVTHSLSIKYNIIFVVVPKYIQLATVLPANRVSDFVFCLQSYQEISSVLSLSAG